MNSILAYSRCHFQPDTRTYYDHSSAGRLARRLYGILALKGSCSYFDLRDKPVGLITDLLIAPPDNFEHLCLNNRVTKKVLWCAFPCQNKRVLELCDVAIAVGNRTTLLVFPDEYRHKVHLVNYSVDADFFQRSLGVERKNEFVHVSTEASVRKGFLEVMAVWKNRPERLHILGYMNDPIMQDLFRQSNQGQMLFYDYVPSDTVDYLRVLKECRFVHFPTHCEGQAGTLLEAMYSGLIALTTLNSGLDERVLEHAFLTDPEDVETQRIVVGRMLSMPAQEYGERQLKMLDSLKMFHSWELFDKSVNKILAQMGSI